MPGHAGFDRADYPGDSTMDWLIANTNLVWCGYYLGPAPSYPYNSWMGHRATLQAAGWGIAPLFVGQQVIRPGSLNPSTASGVTDGNSAADLMTSEGFAAGSYVFLDLENGPPFPNPQQDYVSSWCNTVVQRGFGAGVYCSHLLALKVHGLVPQARIWAFHVPTNQSHPVPNPYPDSNPSLCGYLGAYIWQLGQECVLRVQAANLNVDLDSALTPDPGAPDPS